MINGDYILVVAPEAYPGKKYRNKYCYEHHLVYWYNTGIVPSKTQLIHHINENKHDNSFENLELKDKSEHSRDHGIARGKTSVEYTCLICCGKFIVYSGKTKNPKYCSVECQWESMRRKKVDIPHGTRVGYSHHRCRCFSCKEANRLACANYRRKKKVLDT